MKKQEKKLEPYDKNQIEIQAVLAVRESRDKQIALENLMYDALIKRFEKEAGE